MIRTSAVIFKFLIQSAVAGFTTCQALVKVCVTVFLSMEEQNHNDGASAGPSETAVGTTMNMISSAIQASGPVAQCIKMATLSGLKAFAQMCLDFLTSMERATAADGATFEGAERVRSRESGKFEMWAESSQSSTPHTGADLLTVKDRTPYVDTEDKTVG